MPISCAAAMPGATRIAIRPPSNPGMPCRLCTPQVSTIFSTALKFRLNHHIADHAQSAGQKSYDKGDGRG